MRFVIGLALFVTAMGLPAFADTVPVHVAIPFGLTTSDIDTSSGPDAAHKYVTIDSVRVVNPSHRDANGYEPKQFHLLVADARYLPVVRPGLGALDLSEPAVLGPGQATQVTVTFLVPAATTAAKFEFTPHWQNDDGATVDWCCYYL
jgi:hypothetical protein